MNQAQDKGLIVPASRKNFVSNTLVLIAPEKSGSLPLAGLGDLASPEVKRVALGNPETVPVGRYTQEALTKAGLWETLKPKFIYGESVRQVLDYVSRGEVDAGFVFATDAAIAKGKVKTVAEVQGTNPSSIPWPWWRPARRKPWPKRSWISFSAPKVRQFSASMDSANRNGYAHNPPRRERP